MSNNGKKETFWSALAEALVIRRPKYVDKPKVQHDSFGADLANAFALCPVYRRPAEQPTKAPEENNGS